MKKKVIKKKKKIVKAKKVPAKKKPAKEIIFWSMCGPCRMTPYDDVNFYEKIITP